MSTFRLDEAIEILRATPATVRALMGDLTDGWLLERRDGAWSAAQVVQHLIFGEMTDWIPRARIILEHGEARAFDPFDHGAQFEGMGAPRELLAEFEAVRARSLADLKALALTDETLAKRGTHPRFGPVTMAQLIATWAAHDLNHLSQITEAMAKRYTEAVGPWREFLTILDRKE